MQRITSYFFLLLMAMTALADETIDYETGARWLGGEYLQHRLLENPVSVPGGAVFAENHKLVWVTLDDPSQPQRLDELILPDTIIDIDSAGDLVAVAMEDSGVRLYSIVTGEESGLQLTAYVWLPNAEYVEGVVLTRNRLWVTKLDGLQVFDVSDPQNPSELDLAPGFDSYAYGVVDCGDQILLTDLDGQVKLYDVTNWANPVLLDVYQDSESGIGFIKQIVGTEGMFLVESQTWNGEEDQSTCIQLAVTGEGDLVEVTRRELRLGYEYHLDAHDGLALVVGRTFNEGGYGLVMDLLAGDLEFVSGIRLWGQVYSGFLSGGKAIIGTKRTGLHVFDLHSSQGVYDENFRPVPIFISRTAMGWAKSGQYVGILYREYFESDDGQALWNYTLDLYDSDVPLDGPIRTIDLNSRDAGNLTAGEAGFYCKRFTEIGVPPEIIHIDPTDPIEPIHPLPISGFQLGNYPVEVAGRYFFFIQFQTHSVVIVDLEHDGGATVVGTINNHVITDVTFHDGRLYASSLGRLTVWSIDDPSQPVLFGEAPARGQWIEQVGEHLVCGWHEIPDYVPGGMISVMRLDSPTEPKLIRHELVPWEPLNVVEMGSSLYFGTGTGILHFGTDEMGYLATRDLLGIGVNSDGLFGVTRSGLFPLPRDDEDVLSNDEPIPEPDDHLMTGDCRIIAAAPNPFNPLLSLDVELERPGRVVVSVYDLQGRRVRTLVDRRSEAGALRVFWDGISTAGVPVSSGTYVVSVRSGQGKDQRTVQLIR